MNNEEVLLDIDKLYNIVKELKESKDERNGLKAILAKNPGPSIRQRYHEAKLNYIKALTDFDFFVKDYTKVLFINENDFLKELNKEDFKKYINDKLSEDIDKYFDN